MIEQHALVILAVLSAVWLVALCALGFIVARATVRAVRRVR